MSKRYLMPHDTESAKQAMKSFSELAYAVAYKEKFQAAVKLLYGSDFVITEDLSKRMQFACIICNREMNSENAMQEHYRSGPHQKNRDKRNRESGGASAAIDAYKYSKDSLQFRLLTSQTNPIGLQMVEEYRNDRNNSYYKCFLCGAHGKLSDMYNHIINKAHTEKYIKNYCSYY
ncbi:unnamed protein product [Meganyctiphanes norvegica]|uniref:C2H2-type domain-containing protein n=1 Tax=Meganyctiphanes norvegica TaxID=48144 RepID=A0AAV2R417_MEGNR